jgi:DNA-binding NtrC family response regulator
MKQQANILVVDDNKDLLNTFSLILKRKGFIVDTAEDGIQAVAKFSTHHFDVVLMDVIMPNMDGINAFHKMKECDPQAKVILVTAYCEADQLQRAIDEGAYGALYKPVDIGKLMELLAEVTGDPSVLIVDDDDDFRFTMAQMLKQHDLKVMTAINGEDAVKIARQKKVNIAFVDIKMSAMNGLETSIKLKEINPHMLIVMMTGYRDEVKPIVDEARQKGIQQCLYKPFTVSELKHLVNQTEE